VTQYFVSYFKVRHIVRPRVIEKYLNSEFRYYREHVKGRFYCFPAGDFYFDEACIGRWTEVKVCSDLEAFLDDSLWQQSAGYIKNTQGY